jgi:excisionase family DNA binding protein
MEDFMTTKEAAEKWNISVRQVQNHCKSGRIKGVLRVGTNYLIPQNAVKPTYIYVYGSDEIAKE